MKTPDEISDQKVPRGNRGQGRKEITAQDHARAAKEDAGGKKKEVSPGDVFGYITAIRLRNRAPHGGTTWFCECICGAQMVCAGNRLLTGHKKSCGCKTVAMIVSTVSKHGCNRENKPTPEYQSWAHMKSRCLLKTNRAYTDYGGRGIKVCDRWLRFENFLADMGIRPSPRHSLDRIDNSGNYEPGNCRWATAIVQANNSRKCRYLSFRGETLTASQWERRVGLPEKAISQRLNRGWSIEKSITTKLRSSHE